MMYALRHLSVSYDMILTYGSLGKKVLTSYETSDFNHYSYIKEPYCQANYLYTLFRWNEYYFQMSLSFSKTNHILAIIVLKVSFEIFNAVKCSIFLKIWAFIWWLPFLSFIWIFHLFMRWLCFSGNFRISKEIQCLSQQSSWLKN